MFATTALTPRASTHAAVLGMLKAKSDARSLEAVNEKKRRRLPGGAQFPASMIQQHAGDDAGGNRDQCVIVT